MTTSLTMASTAPTSFQALVLKEHTDPPALYLGSRPVPSEPIPGTVNVKVLAHSLLSYASSLLAGTMQYPLALPMTPGGGAIVRIVAPLPPDATAIKEGQLAFLDPTVKGRDDGDNSILLGIHGGITPGARKLMDREWRNGTYAECARVPLENVFALDEDLLCKRMGYSFADLAYMTRLMVPMGGLPALDVKAGERVVIAPASGSFGGAAVEVARAMGADVVMVGRKRETLEGIKRVLLEKNPHAGKVDVVALSGEMMDDVGALKGYGVIDKYLDFSPPAAAKSGHLMTCLMALKRGGTACLMGGIQGMVQVAYELVMFNNLTIKGRFMYEREDVKKLIRLMEGGRLFIGRKGGIDTVATYGLKEWKDALASAEQEVGWGKQVVLEPWKE